MLKLLRRDLDWILAFTSIAVALVVAIVFDRSRGTLFVLPFGRHLEDLFGALTLIGAVLGLFVGLRDRLARTEDWIRHRPVSRRRLAFQQHLTSLVVLAAWFLVPLFLRRFIALENDRDWQGVALVVADDPARWTTLLAMTTLAWTGYALAFFSTRAWGSFTVRVLVGAALAAVWLYLSWCFMEANWRLEAWTFALLQIGMTVHLLGLAYRNEAEANDLDRPSSAFTLRANAATLGLALAIGAGVLATELQTGAFHRLTRSWPSIHLVGEDHVLIAAEETGRGDWNTVAVDEEHRPRRGEEVPDWNLHNRLGNIDLFYFGRRSLDPNLQTVRAEFGLGDRVVIEPDRDQLLLLDLDRGEVRHREGWRRIDRSSSDPGTTFRREDGRPLSPESRLFPWFKSGEASLIHDMGDGSFWRLEKAGRPRLTRVAFPENDRIVDLVPLVDGEGTGEVIALGELGAYRFDGENFVPKELDWPCLGKRTRVEDRDPLAPLVVVRDAANQELYRHRYGAYRGAEKFGAGTVLAAALLRSPLALFASLGAGEVPAFAPKELRSFIDPFVADSRRIRLVGASFVFCALLGIFQFFRLKRLGADFPRRRFWFFAIFLGGPALFVLAFLVERPRAHRALVLPERPRLLLKSA